MTLQTGHPELVSKDRPTRIQELVVLGLVVMAFGPYVVPRAGLRTDHVLIYGLLFGLLSIAPFRVAFPRGTVLRFKPTMCMLAFFSFVTFWTLCVTFVGEPHYASTYALLASLENYVQPMALIVLMASFTGSISSESAHQLFIKASRCFIWILVANTGIVLYSVIFGLPKVIVDYWQPQASEGSLSVLLASASMSRYLGVFMQPVESGISYALALLLWTYLCRRRRARMSDYAILILLLIGGSLSVSKTFIVGGMMLFIFYWLSGQGIRTLLNWRFLVFVVAAFYVITRVFRAWSGVDYFLRLFIPRLNDDPNLLFLYSAGRLGTTGSVTQLFASVWRDSPFFGLGFGAITPFDSAYAEFFVQGGLVALVAYFLIILNVFYIALKERARDDGLGTFLLFLVLLMVGAGFGAPVMTLNRFSIVMWVLLMLIYTSFNSRRVAWNSFRAEQTIPTTT